MRRRPETQDSASRSAPAKSSSQRPEVSHSCTPVSHRPPRRSRHLIRPSAHRGAQPVAAARQQKRRRGRRSQSRANPLGILGWTPRLSRLGTDAATIYRGIDRRCSFGVQIRSWLPHAAIMVCGGCSDKAPRRPMDTANPMAEWIKSVTLTVPGNHTSPPRSASTGMLRPDLLDQPHSTFSQLLRVAPRSP